MSHQTRFSIYLTALLGATAAACAAPNTHSAALAGNAAAVACPGGVVHSAADAAKYAACDSVVGDLRVSGSDLSDLTPFASLRHVSGTLELADNAELDDLTGLERLSSVGRLVIENNRALGDLEALRHLRSAAVVTIRDNAELDTLRGLEGLETADTLSLERNGIFNTTGLDNLRDVGTLVVEHNAKLISLSGLKSLTRARSVEIRNNPLLAGYFGLLPGLTRVDEKLELLSNQGLTKHEVREVLERVGHVNSQPALAEGAQTRQASLR